MPETAQTGKSKPSRPALPKHGPKRFDPSEHGGVKRRGWLFLFCGVILPALAIIFETNFHFCARHFFDPFPSPGHVVLFALIPFSNYLVWLATRRDLSNHYAFMSLASGMAMGVACLYTLMFLPLTPMACLFSLALGFGLLGLAPLLSLPCNWISGKTVCHLAARKITYFNAHQVEHLGHMIILVMVIAIELPSTLTRINLSRAAESNPAVAQNGVAWLRSFGSQEVLLRACYERSGRATDILGSLYESAHPLNVDQARRVFYQVTGKPFNSVPIPRSARATIQHTGAVTDPNSPNAGVEDEFDLDTDIAGEAVSGVARGLSVSQSKFSGMIDNDAALASLDWSFAFTNDSKFDREARAKILLPLHAVVTRATLTVKGVEHPATIMVRSAARARYRQSVVEHKDPLLVSTCGLDQVLVQCFPVRPGETMTVKLQIAAPLDIDLGAKADLVLPAFVERNFQVEVPNTVDIQSTKPIAASGLTESASKAKDGADAYHLTGLIDAAHLAGFNAIVRAERDKDCTVIWCRSDKTPDSAYVERVLSPDCILGIKNFIVLIDGSGSMQQLMPQIAQGLKNLPPSRCSQIKVIGDSASCFWPVGLQGRDGTYTAALEGIKTYKAIGGHDDYEQLSAALTAASAAGDTAVLWIHAAQPVTSGSPYAIKASLDGAGSRALLFDMQLVAGPNEILNGINAHKSMVRVPRFGSPSDDLAALFAACPEPPKSTVLQGMKTDSDGTAPAPAPVPASVPTSGLTQAPLRPAAYANAAWTSQPWMGGCPQPAAAAPKMPVAEASNGAIKQGTNVPAGREVDSRLAQIWANYRICLDMQNPDYSQKTEASRLADTFQLVSPVSSAVVIDNVKEPQFKPTVRQVKQSFLSSISPHNILSPLRATIANSYQRVTDQLTSLSSATSTNNGGLGAGALKSKEAELYQPKMESRLAYAPAKSIGILPQSNAGGTLRDDSAKDVSAERPNYFLKIPVQMQAFHADTAQVQSNDELRSLKKQDVPTLQGATDGSIGPQGLDDEVPNRQILTAGTVRIGQKGEAPLFPAAPPALREKAPVGADGAPVPEAKIVPEADTWLLLMVVAMLLATSWFVKRRRTSKM